MKRFFLLVVTLLIALTCALSSVAYAEPTSNDYAASFAYTFMEEFTQNYPNRKAGITVNDPIYPNENGKPSLQRYLRDKLVEVSNGKIEDKDVIYQEFTVYDASKGYNIVTHLNNGSEKQVIVGAHYDGGDGEAANDNASGVAALLIVLNELSKDVGKLPCNITFVLFDGEENGLLGSKYFASVMSQAEKDNTLLMINMDSIANGDNLYVWCENKHTKLADLIVSKSNKLTEKPYAKGTYNLNNGLGYGYVETPQSSDHTPFRMVGIPTALFFSGTYSAELWNYSESTNPAKKTMDTANDTFEKLNENNGAEFVAKIEATANAICKTLWDNDFVQTSTNQRKQLVNYKVLGNEWWAKLIVGVIIIAVVVFALLYYRKLQKGAILGTAEIKNTKVFSTPDADDIFAFEEKKPSAEDIFTFDDKK